MVFLLRPTHWKQTLFMLDKPLSLNAGDSITGTIVLRRNPVWRRHMTVTLHWNVHGGAEKCQASPTPSSPSFYLPWAGDVQCKRVLPLVSTERDKDLPHVEVTGPEKPP